MTVVEAGYLEVPYVSPGEPSPYPPMVGRQSLIALDAIADLPAEMQQRVRYGRITTPMPYPVHDEYTRTPARTPVRSITLDNGVLRAIVLPDFGGRIWSLRDLRADRELLFQPSAIQPANFGLTGAWFAGGIEYNVGATGHTPWSMQPVNAAVLGEDTLRLWEWERIRGVMVRIDLRLPAGSDKLYARIELTNPDDAPKPLYWWTNIAVPQEAGSRTIVPARAAWYSTYTGGMSRCAVPEPRPEELAAGESPGLDITYPGAARFARDYFFDIPTGETPFEAHLDAQGVGFGFSSTERLRFRKLFLWGEGRGGHRWQRWLNDSWTDAGHPAPALRYVEIQGGLFPTQSEHGELPPRESIEWTEAYGGIDIGPELAHGDWDRAGAAVREQVADAAELTRAFEDAGGEPAADAVVTLVHRGSGWASADLRVRDPHWRTVDVPDGFAGLPLPPLDEECRRALFAPWAPPDRPFVPPVGEHWLPVWEYAVAAHPSWWTHYALAIALRHEGRLDEARDAFRRSVGAQETAVAWRGLACSARDAQERRDAYERALDLDRDSYPLLAEAIGAVIEAEPRTALEWMDRAPVIARHGRIRVLRAVALVATGDAAAARGILHEQPVVADLKEGETLLSDAWWGAFGSDAPLPEWADFLMVPDARTAAANGDDPAESPRGS